MQSSLSNPRTLYELDSSHAFDSIGVEPTFGPFEIVMLRFSALNPKLQWNFSFIDEFVWQHNGQEVVPPQLI
jgi:hypothetical protein